MLGVYLALKTAVLPSEEMPLLKFADEALLVLFILSTTLVLSHISTELIRAYSSKKKTTAPLSSLTQNISRVVIITVGALLILSALGVSITPALGALGIGGLAVALALQATLANFFSGLSIVMAGQIKVGNYIELDSGQEGYVTDINWRTTKIRMLPNNIVLIPNEKLTKSIVTNYNLPEKQMAVLVQVGVHYNSDLKKVEKVTCDVAKEIMHEVNGAVTEFDPFIRYHTFADFSINFTVILRAKEFVDKYLTKHEFIKKLHARYAKEGIIIPYPIRAINHDQEKAFETDSVGGSKA